MKKENVQGYSKAGVTFVNDSVGTSYGYLELIYYSLRLQHRNQLTNINLYCRMSDDQNDDMITNEDPEIARRSEIAIERKALSDEQAELEKKEELNGAELKRMFEINRKLADLSDEMENSMQVSLERSTALATFSKQPTSTPGVRRNTMFNNESSIQQAIETSSLAKNLLHIEPCKPAEGSDTISAATYRRWRKMLLTTTELLSEEEKESFFLRSAGPKLMDIYEMLTDTSRDADPSQTPFTDTLSCLDKYFDSDGVKIEACSEFEAMRRNSAMGETNIAYLDRLARAAKNCGFATHEFDKRLMTTLARNTDDESIRKAAIDVDFNGKYRSYVQFRNHLRHMELVKNIGLNNRKEVSFKKEVPVHAIEGERSGGMSRSSYQPFSGRSFNFRDPSRARPSSFSNNDEKFRTKICHRCGNSHDPSDCPCRQNTCFKCGRVGHMKVMCGKFRPEKRPLEKERRGPAETDKRAKKMKVEAVETKPEVNQVRSSNGDFSDSSDD